MNFETLDQVLQWIKDHDDEGMFGYQIDCDTDQCPIRWNLKIKIVEHGTFKEVPVFI